MAPTSDLPVELSACAVVMPLELPSVDEIKKLITRVIHDEMERSDQRRAWAHRMNSPVRVEPRKDKRTGSVSDLESDDLEQFSRGLSGLTLFEAEQALARGFLDDNRLSIVDLPRVLEAKKHAVEKDGLLEYYHQETSFAVIGGMKTLKDWLIKRKDARSERAREFGLDPPRGVLLLGVQGCGKSLCAKAVAYEWKLPLLKFDVARLYTKFIGETESNFRRVMHMAEAMAPIVLWIDEIARGFAGSSSSEADGGVSRRVFGSFVTWLQERTAPVFVVATANDISALPPEMLRKERFDEIFFVDLPTGSERETIFRIHIQKRKRQPVDFDLKALAHVADGFSGAEIEQVVVSALYEAFSTRQKLTTDMLVREIQKTRPISATMAEQIAVLRQWALGRTVPA